MHVVCYQRAEELPSLRAAWTDVWSEMDASSIYQSYEWNEAWWRRFGRGGELFVLAVFDKDRLEGLLPLRRLTGTVPGGRWKTLRFIADDVSDYCRLLARPGREEVVLGACLAYLRKTPKAWDRLVLKEVSPFLCEHTQELAAGYGWRPLCRTSSTTFYIPLRQSWQTYWGRLGKNLRKSVERQKRVIRDYRLVRLRGRDITDDSLRQVRALTRRSPAVRQAGSLFLDPGYRAFHWEDLRSSPLGAWQSLVLLYVGDTLGAFHYVFDDGRKVLDYHGNYDARLSRLSIGTFLDVLHLEDLHAGGYTELDFLRGDYQFKKRYRTQVRQNFTLTLYRTHWLRLVWDPPSRLARWVWTAVRRIAPGRRRLRQGARQLRIRWRTFWRRGWWVRAARILMRQMGRKIFWRMSTDRLETPPGGLNHDFLARRRLGRQFDYRELTVTDYARFAAMLRPRYLRDVVQRFWSGDRCWGAFAGEQLVAYSWFTGRDQEEPDLGIPLGLKKGEYYFYDGMVDPRFRRHGIMMELFCRQTQAPPLNQAVNLVALVDPGNTPMQKIIQRLGFRPVERITRHRVLGVGWLSRKPLTGLSVLENNQTNQKNN